MTDKILIIDNDITLLQTLAARLRRFDFEVCMVASQHELEHLRVPQVAHILFDLKFGNLNGLELIQPLKKRFKPQNFVILSGDACRASTYAAIRAGATDYLVKPIQTQLLLSSLSNQGSIGPYNISGDPRFSSF